MEHIRHGRKQVKSGVFLHGRSITAALKGAFLEPKKNRVWLIPNDAEKPVDKRTKLNKDR